MVVRRFNCFGCGLDGATSYAPNPKPHVFVPNSVFFRGVFRRGCSRSSPMFYVGRGPFTLVSPGRPNPEALFP